MARMLLVAKFLDFCLALQNQLVDAGHVCSVLRLPLGCVREERNLSVDCLKHAMIFSFINNGANRKAHTRYRKKPRSSHYTTSTASRTQSNAT